MSVSMVKKLDNMSVTLITQGKHKFYSGSMDIDIISQCCTANPREADPLKGFQRILDDNRAEQIADYIRSGGTIPNSIILSAQNVAELSYSSRNKTISFSVNEKSFFILDGQHRVFGFRKLLEDGIKYRVPVVIYNELSIQEEARIFIDINTLQKPVPKELLLDIKRLAERENDSERLLDEIFTMFETNKKSYLLNKLSRIDKKKGKISKVTFYDSMKIILKEFEINNVDRLFSIMNSYFLALSDVADECNFDLAHSISKPTFFKIITAHARSVMSMIFDKNPNNVDKISEYKNYLQRSMPGSFEKIYKSTSYIKSAEELDKLLLKRNFTI